MPRRQGPYYKDNPDTAKARAKRNHAAQRETRLEQMKARYQRNKERAGLESAASRAGGYYAELTVELWNWLKDVYGQCCAYCGVSGEPLTVDHIKPISQSGSHRIDNIAPACLSCNSSKHTVPIEDWLKRQGWCYETFRQGRRAMLAAYYEYQSTLDD